MCDNSNHSKVVEFYHIWGRLITLDEVEIYRDIGCMRKCQRMEWRAKTVYENQEQSEKPMLFLKFFYGNGRYFVNEQYYTYGPNSFVADFGGYLGLLLGHSILSVFDFGRDIIAGRLEKRKCRYVKQEI